MTAHRFQRDACQSATNEGKVPILNAASKEDPAKLGEKFNAVNLDIWDFDEQTKTPLKHIPNFVQGDVLKLDEIYPEPTFGLVVLGEFIEHCVPPVAKLALAQCRKVMKDDGWLCLTFPLDNRSPEKQHAKRLLKVIVPGETGHDITVWHQTVWEEPMLMEMLNDVGFEIKHRTAMSYGFVNNRKPNGWGLLLTKG